MRGHQRRLRALALCTLFPLVVAGLAPASAWADGWRPAGRHARGHLYELRRGECGGSCGHARLRLPRPRHHRGRYTCTACSRCSGLHRGFHHHLRHGRGAPGWTIPWLAIHGISGLVVEHH